MSLKIKAAEAKGKTKLALQWVKDKGECERYLELTRSTTTPDMRRTYFMLSDSLEGVNTTLWMLEDQIRLAVSHQERDQRISFLAQEIIRNNDRRSKLIGEINQLFNSPVEEKIYENE